MHLARRTIAVKAITVDVNAAKAGWLDVWAIAAAFLHQPPEPGEAAPTVQVRGRTWHIRRTDSPPSVHGLYVRLPRPHASASHRINRRLRPL